MKHPTVERVVERVNQTTVASRAAGFLEELRSHLIQRTEQDVVPTIHQLAERLARRLLGAQQHPYPVINATGVVGGPSWPAPPLAEAAMHEMLQLAGEYHADDQVLQQQVEAALCHLTGAETAWVAHSFDGAVHVCRQHEEVSVAIARHAGLLDPAEWGLASVATISERLEQHDLVVVDGAGLLGGPSCGIVLGRSSAVNQITTSRLAEMLAVDEFRLAALAATLRIYRSPERVIHQIPVLQLLSTPLENLQQRCERLAPLILEAAAVASAKPQAVDSLWWETLEGELKGPSWAIGVQLNEMSLESALERFQENSPRLVARVDEHKLWLDLRSVLPRWDQHLVAAVESLSDKP